MYSSAAQRLFFPAVLAASILALATALVAQYGFGLEPCVLCQYQRSPYWAAGGAAVVALTVPALDRGGVAWTIAAIFACGAALAVYHFGVEQRWWHAATACAAQGAMPMSFESFRAGPLTPLAKPCDAVDWTVFGVSITAYNAALSAALAAAAAVAARALRRAGS
jgi:disulfide bond formation protein DsbB